MDPEGYSIYCSLRDKYKNIDISLLVEAYSALIRLNRRRYPCKEQLKNREHLDKVIGEFKYAGIEVDVENVIKLWEENYRIPQELITYEYLLRQEGVLKEDGFGTERP
jgi:hypothetical protein